jgi:hypothetical protein
MKEDKWDKLNKELDDALEAEFGSEEELKIESVFERAKSTLRKHLFDNKEKVAKDLEQMREWSKTNKQELTLEEVAEHNYPVGDDWTDEQALVRRLAFINGAKWMEEQMEKLKDFDTWKEWKDKV